MGIVNEFRSYGEDLKDQKNVEKILRSLPTKFDGVVVSIEESNDLTQLSVNELMGSLQSHEQRINRYSEKSIGKAFQARGNIFKDKIGSSHEKSENTFGRGRGIGQTYRGGRDRGRFFLAYNKGRGNKYGLVEIDGSTKYNVLLGDDRPVEAKGKGTIAVKTKEGKAKHINDVLYVLGLAHNFLSVGQLLEKGYLIVFKDKKCIIYDKYDHSKIIATTNMLQNRIFAFNLPCEASTTLNGAYDDSYCIWHIRYGNLNMKA
eukprot:PITA_29436